MVGFVQDKEEEDCQTLTFFSTKYFGRCFTSRYTLPIYSPVTPHARSIEPPMNHMLTSNEVQPSMVLPVKCSYNAYMMTPMATRMNIIPKYEINLNGFTENEVIP